MELEQRLARLEAAAANLAEAMPPRSRTWLDDRSEASILYSSVSGHLLDPICPLTRDPLLTTCPLCGWQGVGPGDCIENR